MFRMFLEGHVNASSSLSEACIMLLLPLDTDMLRGRALMRLIIYAWLIGARH